MLAQNRCCLTHRLLQCLHQIDIESREQCGLQPRRTNKRPSCQPGTLFAHASVNRTLIRVGRKRDHPSPPAGQTPAVAVRSEEHTSELQSLMRISYAVFCLKKKNNDTKQ